MKSIKIPSFLEALRPALRPVEEKEEKEANQFRSSLLIAC
jgi:hypothetical protein